MARSVSSTKQLHESPPARSKQQLRGVVAVGISALLLLSACGTQKVVTGSGDQLPVLHIGQSSQALGAPAAMNSSVASDGWVFNGTAPATPANGPVLQYDATAVSEARVTELATSLGLTNAATKHAHGWEVSSSTSTLRVRDTGEWAYARESGPCSGVYLDIDSADGNGGVACADGSVAITSGTAGAVSSAVSSTGTATAPGMAMGGVSSNATPDSSGIIPPTAPTAKPDAPVAAASSAPVECGPAVDCAPASPPVNCQDSGTYCLPPSMPPAVSNSVALDAAAPVIKAAHVDGTPFVAQWGGSPASVLIDPTIAGLPTTGVQTSISVDDKGVVNGYGRIGNPVELAQYPVISAAEALKTLNTMPRPEIAIACPVDVSPNPTSSDAVVPQPACATPAPMIFTSVAFGLQLQWDGTQTLLVPAWLYSPKDSTTSSEVVGAIAVAPQYIAQPTPIPVPSMSTMPMPVPGSSGGASGVSVGTASSGPAAGSGGTATQSATSYTDNGDSTLTLHFWGGDCSTYSAVAKESDKDVVVFITDTPTNPGGICDAMAKATDVVVNLAAPLGSRQVIDGPSGAQLMPGTAPK